MSYRPGLPRVRRTLAGVAGLALLAGACGGPATPAADPTPQPSRVAGTATAPPVDLPSVVSLAANDPVVLPADGEKFTNPGAIVQHEDRWYMLRNSFTAYPGASRIDLLVSDDGDAWTEATDANPVLTSEDVAFGGRTAFVMSAVVDDGTWVAYLYTYNGQTLPGAIGRATAPAPEGPWTVDPEPVLTPSDDPARYDALRVAEPEVLRVDGEWWMWFTAWQDEVRATIGLATSPDGITWTARDEPVLHGNQGWSRGQVGCPQVAPTADGFVMVYDSAVKGVFAGGVAFSADGRTWSEYAGNPLITPETLPESGGFWQSAFLPGTDGSRYLLESGSGSTATAVYAYDLDLAAARNADLPVASADATVAPDGTVTITVQAPGYDLAFSPGADTPATRHPHGYIDRYPPDLGNEVPTGRASVVHGEGDTIVIRDLPPGDHLIWVVMAGSDEVVVDWPRPVGVRVTVG